MTTNSHNVYVNLDGTERHHWETYDHPSKAEEAARVMFDPTKYQRIYTVTEPHPDATVENAYQADPYRTTGNYIHDTATHGQSYGSPYRYQAYDDGNWKGGADTYQDAARLLFPSTSAGYNLSYYPIDSDGEMAPIELCAECALTQWLTDPAQDFHAEADDGDRKYSSSAICDACSAVISPQLCPECGDPLDKIGPKTRPAISEKTGEPYNAYTGNHSAPLFHNSYGAAIHADCMAAQVAKGEARKTGKLTYIRDGYEYTADPTRY